MNPIEAMARARWESANRNRDYWTQLPQEVRACQISNMRAALIALRDCEVTDAMREAYLECPETDSYRKQVGQAWRAMINAILEEQP